LLLDQLLVLDPIISRIDLAYQVEPLLLLFLSDSTIGYFIVEGFKLALVGVMLGLAFVLVGVECGRLALLDRLLCDLGNIRLAHRAVLVLGLFEGIDISEGGALVLCLLTRFD